MKWFDRWFGKGKRTQPNSLADLAIGETDTKDMRAVPVNNPLDYREDGSIRPGDPAYDFMMDVFRTGKVSSATQRDDGTWETKDYD